MMQQLWRCNCGTWRTARPPGRSPLDPAPAHAASSARSEAQSAAKRHLALEPRLPSAAMTFEYFHIVDAGRARSNNEDSVEVDAENALAVLADGMGGYNA